MKYCIWAILFLFIFTTPSLAQQSLFDSLIKVSQSNELPDTSRLKAYVQLSNICSEEDIIKYAEKGNLLSKKLIGSSDKQTKHLAKQMMSDACNNIGYAYQSTGDISQATSYYKKSLSIRKELKDNKGIGECINNLAYLLEQKGNIAAALEQYHEALKYYELANHKYGMAYALNNIGFIYQKQDDLTKALEYYLKSKKFHEEAQDKHGVTQSLTNIGAIYKMQKKYPEALKTHFQSLTIQTELNDKSGISNSYNNIGYIYENQNELNKALEYYERSYKIREELQEKKGMANSLNNMGRIYSLKFNSAKALECATKSHKLSMELGYPENIRNSSKLLSSIYKSKGNYKESLEMMELFFKMHDSLNNENTRKVTLKQQLKYEFSKKAIADSVKFQESQKVKDAQIAVQKSQIQNDKNKRWALFGGLFLVLVFAIFMYKRVRITQKQNAIIEKQKQHVELQKEIVDQKQKEILDSITYAKRIQYTLLAHNELLEQNLPNFFVYFQPKDIVSGDFYWATTRSSAEGDLFYIAICDSTGHGVPGAFMSLLNISFMNEAINEKNILEPNLIFNYVRDRLISSISKDGAKDGMDGILLCINKTTNAITYSAAQNSPLIVKDGETIKLPSDKMPIGKGIKNDSFNLYTIKPQKGDTLYLYTDGYADQFGGEKGKKFKQKQLSELLLSIANKQINEQSEILKQHFSNWKGNLEQVDDVCLLGIKF